MICGSPAGHPFPTGEMDVFFIFAVITVYNEISKTEWIFSLAIFGLHNYNYVDYWRTAYECT